MSKRTTEIWTLQEISDALQNLEHGEKRIVIPRFQRGQRWDSKQEDGFIDSVRRGYPVGTLLFYKTIEQQSNGTVKEVYTLVDGLQRSTAIFRYMQAPMKFFSASDVSTELVDDVFTLLGFPEPQKNNVAPAIRSTYVDYIHNLKSYKTPQTYPLAKAILTAIPVENSDSIMDDLVERLSLHLQRTIEGHSEIAKSEIPAVVYTGDENDLPEIFSRINSKGTPLNAYEIYAASWPQQQKFPIRNTKIIDAILAKYDALNDDIYTIQGYDREEIRRTKMVTLFEYVFGLGKWLSAEFPLVAFDKHLKADEVTPIGFELLDACFFDTKRIGEIYKRLQAVNANHLEKALVDCIQVVDAIVSPITRFKGNRRKNEIKPIYSKNQIISIIAYVFRERYSLDDLRHVKQSWTDNEELYKRRIFAHFVYDIIIVEWDQGSSKLHNAITSGKYMEPISPTAWESALSNLFEKEQARQERTKVDGVSKADIAFLNCIYLSKFTAMDQLSLEKFDIEHIAPQDLMKDLIKRTSENGGLPISCVANLCYLPEYENRAKGKKTFYQDTSYLTRVTLQDIEEKYSFTSSDDLEWVELPFDMGDFEDLKSEYLSFLQARFEIQKLRFYEVMGINPEEAKRVPTQNTIMTAPMQTGRLKKTKPSSTYDPIISALSHHFGKNLICNARTLVSDEAGKFAAVMAYSKMYPQGIRRKYWFAVHPKKIASCTAENNYYVFACSDDEIAVVFPMSALQGLIERLNVTNPENPGKRYYHMVLFAENGGAKCLLSHPEIAEIDVTEYCIHLTP